MIQSFGRRLRGASLLLAVSMGLCAWPGLSLAATPAPVKGLPDFTELVEHVGPSVVNIRTLEKKVSQSPVAGNPANPGEGQDEEMQELRAQSSPSSGLRPSCSELDAHEAASLF
jgi:S1-C subfamily serine protease